jgi:hypothetical protein
MKNHFCLSGAAGQTPKSGRNGQLRRKALRHETREGARTAIEEESGLLAAP